ncbi:heavy metal translocating P-type ATPase [Halococcus qingdaonensis]|uniref:heavy metal translocating P-type ATPase n=1 Tax=Halococcus qingdaonensis TaxID=224402 RepID=UPI0021166AF9|nr:cation-translocating P-type ATPase [Halococcus qingdaonensis]
MLIESDGEALALGFDERHPTGERTYSMYANTTHDTHRATDTATAETAYFSLRGMHTRACESFLETLATDIDGVRDAAASYSAETVRVTYDPGRVDTDAIADGLSRWGYRASAPSPDATDEDRSALAFDRVRTAFAIIVVAPVYMLYLVFFYPVYLGLYPDAYLDTHAIVVGLYGPVVLFTTITVFGVGFPIFRSAYISLRERQLTLDVLIALSALATYAYSVLSLAFFDKAYLSFDVAMTIIVVATIANYVRAADEQRTVADLAERLDGSQSRATRLADGGTETLPVDDCEAGDTLLVKPGEHVPFDGRVLDGRGAVDESLVTGEARPQRKVPGDGVVGGSIAIDGAFEVRVGDGATSLLDRLRALVWDLQATQTNAARLTSRIARRYVPLVSALAVVTFAGWLLAGATVDTALLTGLSVLVVACPVALALAGPLALGRGLATAADQGVAVLDRTLLERIIDIDIVAFDKTGTLTTGELRVTGVTALGEREELLARAAAVESHSGHPIAAAIDERATAIGDVDEFEHHRYGVSATVEGSRTAVGNPTLFNELGWEIPETVRSRVAKIRTAGELPAVVGWDGAATGVVALADTPREGWTKVVERLAADGRRVVCITGDDPQVAARFEASAIDEVFADVAPEAKEGIVQELGAEGTVAMVGDGTNDAPALAAADVGVAMLAGSDFTATAADALLTSDDLDSFVDCLAIARGTRRRLVENLALALSVPVVGTMLAVAGVVTPVVASALLVVGTLLVVFNSRRSLAGDDS